MKSVFWSFHFLSLLLALHAAGACGQETVPSPDASASVVESLSLWGVDDEDIGGNYRLVTTGSTERIIWHSQGRTQEVFIHGNVRRYRVKPPFIAGSTIALLHTKLVDDSIPGFFVLNTATGERKEGLTEEEWRTELNRIGWQNLPGRTGDYDHTLCGNYRLVRTNAAEVVISNPTEPIRLMEVPRPSGFTLPSGTIGNVRKLAMRAPYVTGYATVLRGNPGPDAKSGFFLLNARTGESKQELSVQEWRVELDHIGWHDPQLESPQ